MKNNDSVRGGFETVRTVVTQVATGNLTSDTTLYQPSPSEIVSLQNVNAPKGNFKSPTPHRYSRYCYGAIQGRTVDVSNDGVFRYEVTREGNLGTGSIWFPPDDPNLYNRCLDRINEQARSALDLSVSIAQAGQVAKAVRDIFDIVHYVRRFPRHALASLHAEYTRRTNLRRAGSGWLAFQYGWKPLAQDAYDTVNQILNGVPNMTKVKARAQSQKMENISYTNATTGFTEIQRINYSQRVEMVIHLNIAQNSLNTLSHFTSLNPASLAWELLPFSFVVDWVYDVGGYIRNAETALLNSMRFTGGYTTTTTRSQNDITWTGGRTIDQNKLWSFSGRGYTRYQSKTRTVMGNYPFPRIPRFEADLGSERLLSAASLLSQHLDRR